MKTKFALFVLMLLCTIASQGQQSQEFSNVSNPGQQVEQVLARVFNQQAFEGVPGWIEVDLNDRESPKMKIYYEPEKHKRLKAKLRQAEVERDSLMALLLAKQEQVSSLEFRQDQLLQSLKRTGEELDSLQGLAHMARTDHQELLQSHEMLREQFVALLEDCNVNEPEFEQSFRLESSLDDVPCEEVEGWLKANATYDLQFNPTEKLGYGVQLAAFKDLCKAYEEAQNYIEQESRQDLYIKAKMRNGEMYYAVICGNVKDIATAEWVASQFANKPEVFIITH